MEMGYDEIQVMYHDFVSFKSFYDSAMARQPTQSQSQPIRDATEKTKNKITSHSYSRKRPNDDDDFVNPPPVTLPIQKLVAKETRMPNSKKVKDSLRKLNTRFPPSHITQTMACLNNEQRRCIQSIGFGSAITMKLQKPPRRLCYWVVDNYDPTTNSIRFNDQNLLVTREKVHAIYGIPMGDIQMSNPYKANPKNRVVKHWKSQFPKSIKRIRLTHVVEMIRKDTTGGPLFIMNFLVLFVSVMIGCPTMGTINQAFLENIKGDVHIKELDCSTAGLIHWTSAMLKDRELEELSKGGFGNVVISSSQDTNMNHIEQEHEEVDDVAASQRDCISPGRFTKEVAQETSEKYEDYNVEEIISEINFNFNAYHITMRAIDTWLVRGIKKFPDSEELRMLVTKRNHEFNLACPYFPNSDLPHDGTFFNGVTTPVHGREITTESKDLEFHEAAIDDDAHNDVVFSTPFTQILDEEAFDILEKSALATTKELSGHQSSTLSNRRESDIKIDDVNTVPLTIIAPRRTKSFVQLTDNLRSPYYKRTVDPNKRLKSTEERVSGCIFAGLDNEWDLVFETKFGDRGHRGIFVSMIPGSKIHGTIIDIWATILNHQERHRNKKSPSRMFFSCTLLSNYILDEAICIEKRYKMFVDRMNEYIEKYKQCTNFKDVDLVSENVDKWDVGLETELEDSDDQQMQLDELRKKYVTKILTSDLNVIKPSLYKMLASYDKLSDTEKESFNTEEHLMKIEGRISLFY
ncbi:hypothetical protein L2E82_13650 [Cichorium intybus]|uniref:Uncharacterized protein n=1 Tax=Cichorium intybus TaxID=13427 RepID=A0ACB9EY76_CICIN|nr:hypothetical protein L2E82_13650 [Cichorium intybus]